MVLCQGTDLSVPYPSSCAPKTRAIAPSVR